MLHKLAVLVCLASGVFASGAVTNATTGPWTAELNGTWRWHAGDDVQWASPSFDDSAWPVLHVPGSVPNVSRYWIRIPVRLGMTPDPGLLLGPFAGAYESFWDGNLIGKFGDISNAREFVPRWQTFPLPRAAANVGDHLIAIRVGELGPQIAARYPRLSVDDNRVGDFAALQEAESALMRADLHPRLLQGLISFGFLLAGLYFLFLPPVVSQGTAFRWLGAFLLGRALAVACEFYGNDGPLNIPANVMVKMYWAFGALFFIALLEFGYALFRRPVPLVIRCVEYLLATFPAPFPFAYSWWITRSCLATIPVVVPVVLAVKEVKRQTAGSLLSLILFVIWGAASLETTIGIVIGTLYRIPTPTAIHIGQFGVWVWDAALLVWVPAIAVQVQKSNLRFRDEQQRLLGEMEAASRVQELLLPSQSVDVPGFRIDASYQPATEVGGDFFQLFPAPNDALLVVVGDVSGKGMKAALVVSVIVGALQNRKSDQPSAVLGELNQVLLSRSEGGFTTCCSALFASDGSLTIANAGHLAPYRNGKEIETPPAFPLGVDGDARWTEAHVDLQPNDRVLWISDGVVEARNDKRDLLGFERAEELTRQNADEIARAAQQFGQEDDITVVSITRQPVPNYVA